MTIWIDGQPPEREKRSRRETILIYVDDLLSSFLYYDRKECEELPRGEIEDAVAAGEITVDEMVAKFRAGLEHSCPGPAVVSGDTGG